MLIEDVIGYQASEDGRHGLFKIKSGPEETVLAIPEDKLLKVIEAASNTAGQAKRILGKDPSEKSIVDVEWWEFGRGKAGELVMSFRMNGGAEMSFAVHQDNIAHMIEVLQAMSGQGPAGIDPGIKKQ